MTTSSPPDRELAALGSIITLVPEVAELIAFRQSLPSDTAEEDARELVMERLRELLFGRLDVPEGLLKKSIWRLLTKQVIPALRKELGPVTVRDAIAALTATVGLDKYLTDYIEGAAAGAPTFPESFKGGVFSVPAFKIGAFESVPVVTVVVTPLSDLDALLGEVRDRAYRDFKTTPRHRPETYFLLARIAELLKLGMGRREITWQLLADRFPEIAAASDEERQRNYKAEYTRERARLRKMWSRVDAES